MCISISGTSPSWGDQALRRAADLAIPAKLHSSSRAAPGQEGLYQSEDGHIGGTGRLSTKNIGLRRPEASVTETRFRATSPQMRSPPIALPPVTSTPVEHRPPLCTSGGVAGHTANASEEGVDESEGVKGERSAPTTEGRSDENGLRTYTEANVLAGLNATPLIVAEGKMAQVGDEARLPSGLVHPQTHIPGSPNDLYMGAGQVGMLDSTIPMDEDEDELEPSLFVVSITTFDPPSSLAYQQPHSYSHGLNIEQGSLIVEDIETEFAADSAMEDARMESWKADASMTTETLQPFSWIPPPVFGTFHAIFPNVPPTQMTALVNPAMGVLEPPTLGEPYAMGSTIPEGATLRQVAPPQDIPHLFVSDANHPSPSVEDGLFKGPEYIVPNLSNTSSSNVFTSQTTSRAFTSPTVLRAGPIPFSPSIREHIEQNKEEVVDLNEEMDPKPGVAASAQHGPRCVLIWGSCRHQLN